MSIEFPYYFSMNKQPYFIDKDGVRYWLCKHGQKHPIAVPTETFKELRKSAFDHECDKCCIEPIRKHEL